MANWRRRCSSRHAPPTDRRRRAPSAALASLALLATGCGHAGDQPPPAAAPVPPGTTVTAAPAVENAPAPAIALGAGGRLPLIVYAFLPALCMAQYLPGFVGIAILEQRIRVIPR